jgi:hypothetical protein
MGTTDRERSATVQPNDDPKPLRASDRPYVALDFSSDTTVMTPEQRLAAFGQLLARALYRRIDRREQSPQLSRSEQKRNQNMLEQVRAGEAQPAKTLRRAGRKSQ